MSSRPQLTGSGRRRFESTPSVMSWYRFYCGALGLVYLGVAALCVFALTLSPEELGPDPGEVRLGAVFTLVFSVPLGVGFFLPFFAGRKPWAWVLGIVLICIGLTSLCCLPVCIILLLQWLKPPVKAYFGREAQPERIDPAPIKRRSSSRRGDGRRRPRR